MKKKNSDTIMGNYINKFFIHNTEISNNEVEKEEIKHPSPIDEVTVEKDIMQTPPIIHKTLIIDPRSITSGITRTPIEVNSTPVGVNKRLSAIPRHLQTTQYLETDMDKIMLCLTPKKPFMPKIMDTSKIQLPKEGNADIFLTPTTNNLHDKKTITDIEEERYKILGLDPRSPAADFDRTPILMPKSIERLRARSQNYLHRHGSYDTDMFCQKFSYCELSSQFSVTEIQALPDLATSATESLNLVIKNDDDKSSESKSSCSSYSSETECISAIEEKLEEQNEFQEILEQDKCNDVRVNESIETKCMLSDTIKVWKDPSVLDQPQKLEIRTNDSDNAQIIEEKIPQALKEEVIITFDNDSIIELANSKNEKAKIDPVRKKKKSLKSDIKITTDENKFFNPSDKNRSAKGRTPLGIRSNNEQVQTLLTKSPQVFKNKGTVTKVSQKNTSPHKRYITKSKLNDMQWDSDSTVII